MIRLEPRTLRGASKWLTLEPGEWLPDGAQAAAMIKMRSLLGRTNKDWWPDALPVDMLHQHGVPRPIRWAPISIMPKRFPRRSDYAALKADLTALMTDSKPWWPADYGHYGPFMIRMAWHAAGTYRVTDGRGGASASGQQRFEPLNSAGPTTATSTRHAAFFGRSSRSTASHISWADLFILAGNVAIESMGGPGLRLRRWPQGRLSVRGRHILGRRGNLGERGSQDTASFLTGRRLELEGPLAAIQMGLIYVNPEGPGGNPDPLQSARDMKRDVPAGWQ